MNASVKLVESVAQLKVSPQSVVLPTGKSVIENLQRSRRIKTALIEALCSKMEDTGTKAHTEEF